MSHFTQIKDIEALEAACQELGLTLLPNTEARGYYGNKIKGDYVIQLKGRPNTTSQPGKPMKMNERHRGHISTFDN